MFVFDISILYTLVAYLVCQVNIWKWVALDGIIWHD
jgi:hypothetical protein